MDANRTKVVLSLEYEPEDFLEKVGDAIGIPFLQIEEDLKRFRDFIEERGRETGGWRGEIILGQTLISCRQLRLLQEKVFRLRAKAPIGL